MLWSWLVRMVGGGESFLLYFVTPELSCCDRRGHDLHRRWLVRCFLFLNYEFFVSAVS